MVNRGIRRRIPASISAEPAKKLYAFDNPMNVQSNPIGECCPYGTINADSSGGENCNWITLLAPYEHKIDASHNLKYRRDQR